MPVTVTLHIYDGNDLQFRTVVRWSETPSYMDHLQIDDWLFRVSDVRWVLTPGVLRPEAIQVHARITRFGKAKLVDLFPDGALVLPS